MKMPRWSALSLLALSAPLLLGAKGQGCSDSAIIGSGDATATSPIASGDAITPLVTPCTAELHSFGAYDASGQASVHIERPGQHVIVLSAYEETTWTLTAAPGAEIAAVITNGLNPQDVIAPPGVQVVDYSGAENYLAAAPFSWPADDGGVIEYVAAIQALSGQRLTSYHGCYSTSDFVLHADLSASVGCQEGAASHFADPDSILTCTNNVTTDLPGNVPAAACGDVEAHSPIYGYNCDTQEVFTLSGPHAGGGSCRDLHAACAQYAAANPGASVACRLGLGEIFRVEQSAGACDPPSLPGGGCDGKTGLGGYWMGTCDGQPGSITTADISCSDALENCWINAMLNPGSALQCTWNDQPLYEQEVTPGECAAIP